MGGLKSIHPFLLMTKLCSTCKMDKPMDAFHKNRGNPDGYHTICKQCNNKALVKWRAEHREYYSMQEKTHRKTNPEHAKLKDRRNNLKRNYGITIEEYNEMFAKQNGRCAICHRHQSELKKRLCVDHCHTTQRIRGLLCNNCNHGIGKFKDDTSLLQSAIIYLNN